MKELNKSDNALRGQEPAALFTQPQVWTLVPLFWYSFILLARYLSNNYSFLQVAFEH